MSTALLNRLNRLEARLMPRDQDWPSMIYVSFVSAGEVGLDRNVLGAEVDGRTFVRNLGESMAGFQDRVDAETRKPDGGVRLVLLETEAVRSDGSTP